MKKNKLLFLALFFVMFFPFRVDAASICTGKKLSDLRAKAYKAELVPEQKFDQNHNSYFEVTVHNVDKDILVIYEGSVYEVDSTGTVKLDSIFNGGITYEVGLYGGYDTDCAEEYLYTKKIELPKYNVYSEREECIDYEEFALCNKWYAGDIPDEKYFIDQLELYKESLMVKEEPKPKEKDKNIFEQFIDFYLENKNITIPVTIVIVIILIVIVVRNIIRRRKRIKLKFD